MAGVHTHSNVTVTVTGQAVPSAADVTLIQQRAHVGGVGGCGGGGGGRRLQVLGVH